MNEFIMGSQKRVIKNNAKLYAYASRCIGDNYEVVNTFRSDLWKIKWETSVFNLGHILFD